VQLVARVRPDPYPAEESRADDALSGGRRPAKRNVASNPQTGAAGARGQPYRDPEADGAFGDGFRGGAGGATGGAVTGVQSVPV
jgi:hypothetical protein